MTEYTFQSNLVLIARYPEPVSRTHWDAEMQGLAAEARAELSKTNWTRIQQQSPPRKVQIAKEMPEVLQSLIQEFAAPLVPRRTRPDWRTCKREESHTIYLLWRDKRHVVADFLGGAEFWDMVVNQSFYDLLKNYPAGPPSDEGQTTIQLRRVWV